VYVYKQAFAAKPNKIVNLRVMVTTPPGFDPKKSRAPTIAFFHGGGLAAGAPTVWLPESFYFAARGFITATFQYRLVNTHGATTKQSVADAKSAIRWLRLHAADLGVDPQNIISAGDSSGGYLAVATALNESANEEAGDELKISSVPQLVMALYPVLDGSLPKYTPDLSMTALLKEKKTTLPPMLLMQGGADKHPWTPPTVARAFCDESPDCIYADFPGQDHAFVGILEQYRQALVDMDTFLINAGKISGDVSQVPTWVSGAKGHCQMNGTLIRDFEKQYGYIDGNGEVGGVW
jgi:acetyl esterase/lipase